ncbi:MAG: hypothetical protein H6832_05720 [Planctomycetes bacterium]|nr:hypothetical protein [Planctomycetota bacterium]MCB9891621.1 hypothetical protein [Planctomycetota bacterium]MCB9917882.1 hypothetical protein [Planctomycetota bacterium]
MDGYLGVPNDRVDTAFGGGFSLYVAAWPLLADHPGPRFQTGLFGTWMHARIDGPKPKERLYSDIEGGLGWWRDTRFPTATPKFIMGGVALNFVAWANGPGAGKGRDWSKPNGKYGVAQLSPWVLWPPDGLNLEQGTCGQLFGYGYLPLPLTEPKATTAGADVPTGNQCWTLFLNTETFKGPVAFFTPYFFSRVTIDRPELAGHFLDSRPADPNRALQMETQYVPAVVARAKDGSDVARVAPTRFPANDGGESILVHRITSYEREALWDRVHGWFEGGDPTSGRIDVAHSIVHRIPGKGWSTWRIHTPDVQKEDRRQVDWQRFATPFALDDATFGYRWDAELVKTGDASESGLVTLPEWFQLEGEGKKARWNPVTLDPGAAPRTLRTASFVPEKRTPPEPYVTPEDGCWATPGPVAGPFEAKLGDGSVVTYSWYRFADQPALQNADLSAEERERLQARVELLHRAWRKDLEYLPPPTRGTLARLDPAVLVEPPEGLEVGYVPIATRQEKR